MANEIPIPKLLTVREFAKALRIHRNTAYKILANGEVPSVHLGDRVTRIPISAITPTLKKSVRK